MSAWRFRKEIHLGPGGVHEVELDPDVLSGSDPTGNDLRLVRDGRQVPYLRDDPPRLRSLSLAATRQESAQGGRVDRWALALPRARLPIRRISCVAKETLFRREVRLIDSAHETAREAAEVLRANGLENRTPDNARYRFIASDAPETFLSLGQRFLGSAIDMVETFSLG